EHLHLVLRAVVVLPHAVLLSGRVSPLLSYRSGWFFSAESFPSFSRSRASVARLLRSLSAAASLLRSARTRLASAFAISRATCSMLRRTSASSAALRSAAGGSSV